jgi:hypothetical protein
MQDRANDLPRIVLPETVWKVSAGVMVAYAPPHGKPLAGQLDLVEVSAHQRIVPLALRQQHGRTMAG